MKKPIFHKLIFLFLLIPLFPCYAQEQNKELVWTLKQCIDHALEHNLQVKQSILNIDLARQSLIQSRAQTLPNLNGFATHAYNFGQTIDPFTNQFANDKVQSNNFALSSNMTLFNGFQTVNTIRQNQINVKVNESAHEKMKNDISLSIAMAYLQVLFSEELLLTAKNQVNITLMQVGRMQKMVDAGALPKYSLLELEAQQAMEELNVINSENQRDLAYLSLKQLLDLDMSANLKIVTPQLDIPSEVNITSTPGQVYEAAITILPEIKGAEYSLLSSGKTLQIAKGGMSPRLSLQGSLGTGFSGLSKDITGFTPTGFRPSGYYTASGEEVVEPTFEVQSEVRSFDKQIDDNFNKNIGLNLTIPIFNSLSVRTNIAKAKIAQKNAELDLATTKLQVQKNVQQAYSDAVAALKKYNATSKSLNAIEESFKYAAKRFSVGDMNTVEYNDAKNKLIKVQSDLLQAKYDFVFRQKILDFYQGKSLVF